MPSWILFFMIVVGLPVLATMITDIYKRHVKFKERQLEIAARETAEKAAQYAAHTARLEQRVQILERIVTDTGVGVAAEIEQLRDQQQLN